MREKERNIIKKYLNISPKVMLDYGIYYKNNTYETGKNSYYIGSISKVFTALLTLKTIDEKNIDINTNVNDYLLLKNGNYPTIYECLTHTAGYHHLTPYEQTIFSLIFHSYSRKNPYENVDNTKLLRMLENRRNKKINNHGYHYSDFNYAILAIVLEKIYNNNFITILKNFIKNDLGLVNTYVGKCDIVSSSTIHNKYIKDWVWHNDNPYLSGGGIISNASDMLKFSKYIIDCNYKYLEYVNLICEESIGNNNKITTLAFHSYKNSNQLWHVGGIGTHRSMLIINKEKKIAVIVLGNSKGKRKGNVCYICKMLYSYLKKTRNIESLYF